MDNDIAIPTLPCVDLDDSVAFYTILGFKPVLVQKSPVPYAVLRRGGAEIHLYRLRELDPDSFNGGCIVEVDEVEALHASFAAALKAALGRVPVGGRPRLTRMRKGQSRFSVVDPSGNWVLFARRDEEGYGDGDTDEGLSPLARALRTARRLRDYKHDDKAVARVLDSALGKAVVKGGVDYARALLWRAEIARITGEAEAAGARLEQFAALALDEDERAALADDLAELDLTAVQD